MNIPEVGQKYLCVCHDRKSYADFGQEVEVVKKQNGVVSVKNTTTGKEFAWNYVDYPDDFKLVEFTTEHGTFLLMIWLVRVTARAAIVASTRFPTCTRHLGCYAALCGSK